MSNFSIFSIVDISFFIFPFLCTRGGLLRIYLLVCVFYVLALSQAAAFGKKDNLFYCLFGTWEGLFVYVVFMFYSFSVELYQSN